MSDSSHLPAPLGDLQVAETVAGPVVETPVRVRFAETDAMGVVYHANYLVWFEVGRGAYWRALGPGTGGPQDAGSFPVSAIEAHYHASARYGDTVVVRTRVLEVRSRSLTFGYECIDEASGRRLAVGRSTHLLLDAEGHARRLPAALRRALTGCAGAT